MKIEITSSKGHKRIVDVRDRWDDWSISCYIQDVVMEDEFNWTWRRIIPNSHAA